MTYTSSQSSKIGDSKLTISNQFCVDDHNDSEFEETTFDKTMRRKSAGSLFECDKKTGRILSFSFERMEFAKS